MQKPHLAFKNGVILLPVHISGLQIIYQDLSYSVFFNYSPRTKRQRWKNLKIQKQHDRVLVKTNLRDVVKGE